MQDATPVDASGVSSETSEPSTTGHSVTRSAGIISAAVMVSRVLGLVREQVFAYFFGASKSIAGDAFSVAFRIPNLLRDLFAEGALSSAFVTVFSDYLATKGEKEAFQLSSRITTALILVLGVLVVLGIIFAPQIVAALAHGYLQNPAKFELTVELTRIMMPFILLVALAAQAMGILNSRNQFGIPALSSSFFNIGSVIGGVFFAVLLTDPTFSDPFRKILANPTRGIIGMAYGTLIGGFLQYAIQWPSLRRAGFRYRPLLSLSDPGVRRFLGLMGPAIIGGAAVQVNILVNTNFASSIPENGPVRWLEAAFRFMQFPIGVFGVAIATATLPAISRSAALEKTDEFRRTMVGSIRLAFLLTIPSAVGLAVLSRPIVALIYEWGNFTSADTGRTAAALAFYAIGLSGYSATKIIVPAFYALRDSRTPMMISVLSILVNFVMNWSLVGLLKERGLALSTSTVALLNFGLLYVLMRRRLGRIDGRETLATVIKIILSSAAMGACCWLVSAALSDVSVGSLFVDRFVGVAAPVISGAAVFYLGASLLRISELKLAVDAIGRKLLRKFRSR